jgi:hypothetical protein
VSDERVLPEPARYTPPELPTCEATGKVAFRSPEEAQKACREIRRRHDDRVHPYRCDQCRRWHVGHSETDKKTT